MAELDLGGKASKLSYFSDYHQFVFCRFFLSRVAGEERPGHTLPVHRRTTQKDKQPFRHTITPTVNLESPFHLSHRYMSLDGELRENPRWQGGEDVNAAGPWGFKCGTFLR